MSSGFFLKNSLINFYSGSVDLLYLKSYFLVLLHKFTVYKMNSFRELKKCCIYNLTNTRIT